MLSVNWANSLFSFGMKNLSIGGSGVLKFLSTWITTGYQKTKENTKLTNSWRLHTSLMNERNVKTEIKEESRDFLEFL